MDRTAHKLCTGSSQSRGEHHHAKLGCWTLVPYSQDFLHVIINIKKMSILACSAVRVTC